MKIFLKGIFFVHFIALNVLAFWATSEGEVRRVFLVVLFAFLVHFILRFIYKEVSRKRVLEYKVSRIFADGEASLSEEEFLSRTGLSRHIISKYYGQEDVYTREAYKQILQKIE